MVERTVSPEELARLKAERDEASRRYNDALTALDHSKLHAVGDLPHPPPAIDEFQITPLNERWRIVAEEEPPDAEVSGWRRRVAEFVWRLIGPYVSRTVRPQLERQQAFNAALVDHVNRSVPVGRATRSAIESTLAFVRDHLAAIVTFEWHLMAYLQQMTPYVDAREREQAGLARRVHEDNRELIELLSHRTVGLAGAISGVGEELLKRWEAMLARERRFEGNVRELKAGHDDLRTSVAAVVQATHAIKRQLAGVTAAPPSGAAVAPVAPASAGGTIAVPPAAAVTASSFQQAGATTPDAFKYVGFENEFRGSVDQIRARQASYVELFAGAEDVVDVGCGRGEFLDLLRARGVPARGVDLNLEMVSECRERGLDVEQGDAVSFLGRQAEGSIGGLIALQVVEHFQPDYLIEFLDAAYHALRPGAPVVLETINPACWVAFFESYIRDLTHARAIHPDTLSYYVSASGFQNVRVRFSAPCPDEWKLQRLEDDSPDARLFNHNVDLINARLFTYQDYAVVGERA